MPRRLVHAVCYFTVRLYEAVCVRLPEVAVMVTVKVPAGVPTILGGPGGLELPPPEELAQPAMATARRTSVAAHTASRVRCFLCATKITTIPSASSQPVISRSSPTGIRGSAGHTSDRAVVVIVTVAAVAALPLGVTKPGETAHVVVAGAPLHVKDTPWLNPPTGVTMALKLDVCPALTLPEFGELVTAKSIPIPKRSVSWPPTASVTISDPRRVPPCVGWNVTWIAQLAPAASLFPQLLVWLKSPDPDMEIPEMLNAAVPLFVSVTDRAALVEPTSRPAKFTAASEREASGVGTSLTASVTLPECVRLALDPLIVRVEFPAAVALAVETVNVEAPVPLIVAGEKLGVAPAGSPLALSATDPIKPLIAVTLTVYVAGFPAVTVCDDGDTENE